METSTLSSIPSSASSSAHNKKLKKTAKTAYNTKLGLTPDVVESAKKSLFEFAQREEERAEPGSSEVVVRENVSLDAFLTYRERDVRLPVRVYLCNGKIIINEIPTVVHARVSATIKILMGSWNHRDLAYFDDATMILGQNTAKEPDSMVRPERRPQPQPAQAMDRRGTPYPTMIIEVGHAQTLSDLHRKVALYFNPRTTIQIVLAVKLNEPRRDNTIAIIVALYLRTSPTPLIPVDVRSFGTAPPSHSHQNYVYNIMGVPPHLFTGVGLSDANNNPFPPCARAGIPAYKMNIPATELFNGDPTGVPASAVGGFNLDLWELQFVARREFKLP